MQSDKREKTDPNKLAGGKNSLGAESKRDGRPSTDDRIVEAIDEEGPEIPRPDPQRSDG